MTEKRFTKQEVYDGINRYQINKSNFIVEILDDGIPMHYSTIFNRLNEQHKTITRLEKENEQLKAKNDRLEKTLQKHYNYVENQRLKYLDNTGVHSAYSMLRTTIMGIAEELEVELNVK